MPTTQPAGALSLSQSTAAEASHVFKTSAGNMYLIGATNTGNSGFVMLIDGTTVPSDGALTSCGTPSAGGGCLMGSWPISGGSSSAPSFFGFQTSPGPPISFVSGLIAVYSSTGPTTKTLGGSNIFFQAQVD